MTTVAGQSVGPDSISGAVKGGTKLNVGNVAGFLGAGQGPNLPGGNAKVTAGTQGGAVGPGANCLPNSGSAAPLTSVEKPFPKGGV